MPETIDLTKSAEESQIQAQSAFDAAGNLRVAYEGITAEDMESLKALATSPHWRVYRVLLQKAVAEYMRASWQVTDVNGVVKMVHNAGLAAGINFSINQVQVLCADYDKKQKEAIEKAEKKPQPFRKG